MDKIDKPLTKPWKINTKREHVIIIRNQEVALLQILWILRE